MHSWVGSLDSQDTSGTPDIVEMAHRPVHSLVGSLDNQDTSGTPDILEMARRPDHSWVGSLDNQGTLEGAYQAVRNWADR